MLNITERVEFGGTPQRLSAAEPGGALTRVVHDSDGNLVGALQVSEIRKDGGDLAGCVFINAVQADKRIEDEQPGSAQGHGLGEAAAVVGLVEAQRGDVDDLDVGVLERDPGGATDAVEALADDMERILGGIEEDGAGGSHGEAPEAGSTRGDGHSHLQGEKRLAALGLAADDADGLGGPELVDEPAFGGGLLLEEPRRACFQAHRDFVELLPLLRPGAGGGGANSSK